jgi:3-oxoadipate enol-lactonase
MPAIQVNGANLWYEKTGSGPSLVLIHGLGSSGRDWEPQVAGFSDRHTVLTVDLRGHGQSERAVGDYSIALFAADVAAVMEKLGLGAAHVCGISLGGAISRKTFAPLHHLVALCRHPAVWLAEARADGGKEVVPAAGALAETVCRTLPPE